MKPSRFKAAWNALQFSLGFLVALFLFQIYQEYQLVVRPIVTDFQITQTERVGDDLRVWGTFDKQRNCNFYGLSITHQIDGVRHRLPFKFEDADRPELQVSRVKGLQYFGPWRVINVPENTTLNIEVIHDCHSSNYLVTNLGSVDT